VTDTMPTAPNELEDMLGSGDLVNKFFNADGTSKPEFGEFITNYARATLTKQKDESGNTIGETIKVETQKALGNYLRDHNVDVSRLNLAGADPFKPRNRKERRLYNQRAVGKKADGIFGNDDLSIAEFFQATWHNVGKLSNRQDLIAKRDRLETVRNEYSSIIPADGGFLVPEEFRQEIMALSLESSLVRSRARVIPMSSLKLSLPAVDSTSNVTSVFGGVVFYWTEEGAELTESEAQFKSVTLEANKLTGLATIPNELLADAPAFAAFFDQIIPQAHAWYEDLAFINGNGAGEPKGWRNASSMVTQAKEAQAADTIVWENLVGMYSRMLPSSLGNATWVVSPDTFPELATMALSVGTGGSAIWLNNGVEGPPARILGRPVEITEKVPSLGNEGDVSFIDLGYYLIGDRQMMQVDSSPHVKFTSDKTVTRMISRTDGREWLETAITPNNGGPTLSPFVQLAERA